MKKLIIIVGVILTIVAGYFIVQNVIENKIERNLKTTIDFDSVELQLLNAQVKVLNPVYQKDHNLITAENIFIDGVSYLSYLFDGLIEVEKISCEKLKIEMESGQDSESSNKNLSISNFKKEILVHKVEFDGALRYKQDSLRNLKVNNFKAVIDSIVVNKTTLKKKVPLNYGNYTIKLDQVDYVVNKLQQLKVEKVYLDNSIIKLDSINYLPRFSEKEYIEVIPYEKDLMNLYLKNLKIEDYKLALKSKKTGFTARFIKLDSPDFSIYRDKTVKDDVRKKKLYSRMLREANVELNIDSVKIKNMNLDYRELINKGRPPGHIYFSNVNANIYNVTNLNLDRDNFPETKVFIDSKFMGKSPFHVEWSFKVNNLQDEFTIQGSSFQIAEQSINSFFVPAMGMKTTGEVEELYFNYAGDKNQARGQLKLNYKDFKVDILKKDSEKENKILSALANVFVKKNSGKNGQAKVNPKAIQRDKTKSFWNYFWVCIESGLKDVILKF